MSPLSALLPSGTENPRKTADFALLNGDFEQLLAGGTAEATLPDGKILPEGGKALPDGLPGVELPSLAGRKLIAEFLAKEDEAEQEVAEEGDPQTAPLVALPALAASVPEPAREDFEQDILSAPKRPAVYRPVQSAPVPEPVRKAVLEAVAAREARATPAAVVAPVLDPSVTEKGERPADAPQPARIAPGNRNDPMQQIRLQFSAESQPEGQHRTATPTPAAAAVQHAVAAQSTSPEAALVQAEPAPVRDAAAPAQQGQSQTVRPQDLTALVDRLVEARDNARSNNASLTVMHADFGRVSMHFAHDNGNLTVSLANSDPGFARAVSAAVAPDGSMNADTQPQGDRRGDTSQNGPATRDSGLAGERGGQPRGERHERGGTAANPSHRETAEAHAGQRGIFA